MNDIAPIGRSGFTALGNTNRSGNTTTSSTSSTQRGSDEVTLSANARYLSQMQQMPGVRQGKVAEVRQAINNGTYETDAKLNAVLEPLMQDLT